MSVDPVDWCSPGVEASSVRTTFAPPAEAAMPGLSPRYLVGRRILDISVAVVLAVLTAPLAAVAAVLIATSGRGPILFTQIRVGRGGETFRLVKFRTMRPGTQHEILSNPDQYRTYAAKGFKLDADDPRITRVGRWLRRTSVDELPQLLNVLAGQMSIVGVRPLIPDELAQRSPTDQDAYTRLRPGLTGLWQVEGRSGLDPVSRRELDRIYLTDPHLRRDLAILARTPRALTRTSNAR